MAGVLERCEAEVDLDVTFNEFDEEFGDFSGRSRETIAEKLIEGESRQDSEHLPCRPANGDDFVESAVTTAPAALITDETVKLAKVEEGEISSSSEDEAVEKMDCEEENDREIKSFSQQSEESLEKPDREKFTFLSPNSVFKESGKKKNFEVELESCTLKRDYEAETAMLSMESDNSMDDQSWKRHKRARLEEVSREADDRSCNDRKDEQRKKRRGGRKRRKRPLRSHSEHESQRGNSALKYTERKSGNKLFEPLTVTSENSENAVAREISDKLSEAKTMLIQRVVTCIGCEKAIKLFRDTQEVERHGGIWTKDGERRRTSGGVFLMLLKHRYVTKEQSKWIFALENEILKKKAKEEQKRMKELQKKNIADLRLKLIERDKE